MMCMTVVLSVSVVCFFPFPCVQALKDEDRRQKQVKSLMAMDERKRPYNSMTADSGKEPTEEELEAYHRKKQLPDDPMANFIDAV